MCGERVCILELMQFFERIVCLSMLRNVLVIWYILEISLNTLSSRFNYFM
jgi:hypothetical protein